MQPIPVEWRTSTPPAFTSSEDRKRRPDDLQFLPGYFVALRKGLRKEESTSRVPRRMGNKALRDDGLTL
jgi:hypothetical protein